MSGSDILASFDARDWARAFVEHARQNPSIATDEGTMIAWFANALMRGYDEHYWRTSEYKRMIRRVLFPWWSWRRWVVSSELAELVEQWGSRLK